MLNKAAAVKRGVAVLLTAALLLAALSGCMDTAEEDAPTAERFVGQWHLADETDLGALSESFPGAAEFGSNMEIRADGTIFWYVGMDGATGTYAIAENGLIADVTGEPDGEAYRVALTLTEPDRLAMTFKGVALVWTAGAGESLRGEDD